jgi:hypothetical protein
MMAFAIANVPHVYDECDHNVMRLAPLHGCRARSAHCAGKQRIIRDAIYGCFDPTRKVMSGTQRAIPKSGHRFSEKITREQGRDPEKWHRFRKRSRANKVRDPEKWAPVFGKITRKQSP